MNSLRAFGIFFLLLIFASCGEDTVVKPSAMLRLQYPLPQYKKVTTNCPYSFEKKPDSSSRTEKRLRHQFELSTNEGNDLFNLPAR